MNTKLIFACCRFKFKQNCFFSQYMYLWHLKSVFLKCRLGKDFPSSTNSGMFRCAVCQADQPSGDGLSMNTGSFFSPVSKPWEGPFLCTNCQKKKDAMEGKRSSRPSETA